MFKLKKIIFFVTLIKIVFPITIQEVYDNASSFEGYDKYLILERNEIYTGTLGIYEGRVFIKGNGATLDLIGEGDNFLPLPFGASGRVKTAFNRFL